MDLPADHRYHRATLAALGHMSEVRGIPIEVRVVPTDTIRSAGRVAVAGSAVIVGPGSPYRDPRRRMRSCWKRASGTSRWLALEVAFNMCWSSTLGTSPGLVMPSHAEYGPGGTPVITLP